MALMWLEAAVPSPFGAVRTLHWGVGSTDDDAEEHHGNLSTLDSAQDQLGSVLWNSNSVVLTHLVDVVLPQLLHRETSGRPVDVLLTAGGSCSERIKPSLKGLNIVELGAGVGCLGIALAMGGANVAITDLKELVPLMKKNISLNAHSIDCAGGTCSGYSLRWGDAVDPAMQQQLRRNSVVNVVVMCDALYGNSSAWAALLDCLEQVHNISGFSRRTLILNYCEQRVDNHEDAFFDLLRSEKRRKWCLSTCSLSSTSELNMNVRCACFELVSASVSDAFSGRNGDSKRAASAVQCEAMPSDTGIALPRKRKRQ